MKLLRHVSLLGLLFFLAPEASATKGSIVVGSKNFTESCILGELMAQMIEAHTDLTVERRINLGGTLICFSALREGEIDLYADYTGTGWAIVLKEKGKIGDPLRAFLYVQNRYSTEFGIRWLMPFGLNNTYALAMREEQAESLGVRTISDLSPHAARLTAGFSIEFMNREDGWPGLSEAYHLPFSEVRGLEHGLAYTAINAKDIDVIDAYGTDGKLLRYPLRVLEDDLGFFPPYNAAPLVREDSLRRFPELEEVLDRLAFRLPDERMQELNYRVEEEGQSFSAAAREFLASEGLLTGSASPDSEGFDRREGILSLFVSRRRETLTLGLQHVLLVGVSVALAAFFAIPLGIFITRTMGLSKLTLGVAGVIQTIPSLALLAFMIPLLGLNTIAAIVALFLYAILPILRNTFTAIREVDPDVVDAARGMGLRGYQILLRIELPLALPTIMAGVRTATVISIGVATLAAFIGAGGFGEPIVTGLYLNDTNLILTGAIPAALLAILADLLLGLAERFLAPRGMAAGTG